MNHYQPPLPAEEAGRRLRAYPALVAALQEIAAMRNKTLLGGRDEHDPGLAHEIGANKAFRQAASVAHEALAVAGESAEPVSEGDSPGREPHEWLADKAADALA